jgi:hypothetical protein
LNTLRRYIFWTYERGSFHYDVMVTVILLFIFVSPHYIDFNAKPVTVTPLEHSQVLVKEQGSSNGVARFVYEIRVDDLHGASTDAELRTAITEVIEPIGGNVTLQSYAPVQDTKGHIVAYEATVIR